ncbi:MAG: LysR family transcriptional regulator [Pseudomonadota bacterium]
MNHLRVYRYIDAISRAGSIRQAAEKLAITPSALNRRVIALEHELGVEIFERLGRGVRLSTAGELLVDAMRKHLAETEVLKSRIADLSGLRRGHVSVACSQAVLPHFLPDQIQIYQETFPDVTFSVFNHDGSEAAEALLNYTVDLAVVFEPMRHAEFHTAFAIPQPIHAYMAAGHPLAAKPKVSFSDCLEYPLALPNERYAVRQTVENLANRISFRLHPAIEADSYVLLQRYVVRSNAIAFELQIGLPHLSSQALVSRPISLPQSALGRLNLVHLKGRTLPVASARFAQQLTEALDDLVA